MGTLKPTSGSDSDDEPPFMLLLLPFLVDDCAESALDFWGVLPGVTIERALELGMLEKDVDLDFDP